MNVCLMFTEKKKGKKGRKIRSVELGMRYMPERKTTENIKVALREICNEWQINVDTQVKGVVTDGGANVKAAARQLFGADKHITCAGHVVNSIGQAVLGLDVTPKPSEATAAEAVAVNMAESEEDVDVDEGEDQAPAQAEGDVSVRGLLMEVKRIVRFFRSSDVASEELKKQQMKQPGMTEYKCLKLIQEVRTRWNSAYYMLDRYLHLEEHITAVLFKLQRERGSTKRKPPPIISADKVNILVEIRDLMKPLEEATKMLSKEKDVTLSNVIPLVYGLKQVRIVTPR